METAEPGGVSISKQIRRILLEPANTELQPSTEILLYFAARAQNTAECIKPAIESGAFVLSDRFTDSTMAYQGYARGLGAENVLALHRIACGDLQPDLTLLLDIDRPTGLERMKARGKDRIEQENGDFFDRVREGYARIAKENPDRVRIIDARGPVSEVSAKIWEEVSRLV